MGNRFDAVLFDLDGTLVDTWEDLAGSLNFMLARLGRPARTPEEVKSFIGEGVRHLIGRGLGPGADGLVDQGLALFAPHYQAHCADRAALYPGARETLQKLSDRRLAVVTNKPQEPSLALLRHLNVEQYFQAVIGGIDGRAKKPSPKPLLEAVRRLSVKPARALMVGDSPIDVQAAKAAGVAACAVTFGYRPEAELRAEGPDFVIGHFSEILTLI